MSIFQTTILCIVILSFFLLAVIFGPTKFAYMFIFEHEEWKKWRYFRKNIHKFEYDTSDLSNIYKTGDYVFRWDDYRIIVWDGRYVSIHNSKEDCICSPFWMAESKKFANILMNKLKEEDKHGNN